MFRLVLILFFLNCFTLFPVATLSNQLVAQEDEFNNADLEDIDTGMDEDDSDDDEGLPEGEDSEDFEIIDDDDEKELILEDDDEPDDNASFDESQTPAFTDDDLEEAFQEESDSSQTDQDISFPEEEPTSFDEDSAPALPESEEEESVPAPQIFEETSEPEIPEVSPEPVPDAFSSESLNLVNNIRYIAGKDQIVIDCSEVTSYQIRRNDPNNQLIVEILQAQLSKNLTWPYILRDFNTNFGLIKADQKTSDTVRIVIQMKEKGKFPKTALTDTGNQILIGYGDLLKTHQSEAPSTQAYITQEELDSRNILPAKTLEELYFGDIKFSGSPISFHVIDAPIKQVLRFISEESGLNMVIGEKVQGTITLKLENIPWDQALHTILKVKSLGYTRDGNVITISPLTEIEARAKKLKEITEQQQPLIPVLTKVIPVTYGQIEEIEEKVKPFLTPKDDNKKRLGGQIITHKESNTLIVIDTEKAIGKIEKLVEYLDKTPKQVMIEARIVEATQNFSKNFGLNWSLGGNLPITLNPSGLIELLGSISGNYSVRSPGEGSLSLNGIPFVGDVGASLNIAEDEDYAKIISSPRVVTMSGKSASITRNSPIRIADRQPEINIGNVSGQNTGGQNTGGEQTGTGEGETHDVQISLEVEPTVTSSGSVFLKVTVVREEPGPAAFSESGQGTIKISRQAETEVLVQNGHTIVIGGIYEEQESRFKQGIPFLNRIPFLNYLFNSGSKNNSKTELLVFLTPKLLDIND